MSNNPAAAAGNPNAHPDFDNDGFADLVIPDGGLDVGGVARAGGIWIVPGSATGPQVASAQLYTEATPGVPGTAAASTGFGYTWTSGDFDGDGYDDLAVGAAGQAVGSAARAGEVWVFYGSPVGLGTARIATLTQNTHGIPGVATAFNNWGSWNLAAGDFNHDGRSDLVVSDEYLTVGGQVDAGAVFVVPGTASGLTGTGTVQIDQLSSGIAGWPAVNGHFGYDGFGVGDFNGDHYDDLTIAASDMSVPGHARAGALYVLFGSAHGLQSAGAQQLVQGANGVPGSAATNAQFALGAPAVGDFDHDGNADIVVAAANDTVSGLFNAGRVLLFRGSARGLQTASPTIFDRNTAGVAGNPVASEQFGHLGAVAGDFNGDHIPDVVVGVSSEDVGAAINAGALVSLYSDGTSLSGAGSQEFTQNSPGIAGSAESNDFFSEYVMTAGDFNGDGTVDLAVPSYGEDVASLANAGAVSVLFGSSSGLTGSGSRLITRSLLGSPNTANSLFGTCCY